jgi:translation initiation factor 4E
MAAAAASTTVLANKYKLGHRWSLYIHLQNSEDWSFESYHRVASEIDSVEKAIMIADEIDFELIKRTIMFVMKEDIKPMWEDKANASGGGFSFKVHNKYVEQVWRKLFYIMVGASLSTKPDVGDIINGISVSPKKSFCIIKVWMKTCKYVNPDIFVDVTDLDKSGCLFKKHGASF